MDCKGLDNRGLNRTMQDKKRLMGRLVIMLLVLTVIAFAVTACGKKGDLEHRDGTNSTYPRAYPTK